MKQRQKPRLVAAAITAACLTVGLTRVPLHAQQSAPLGQTANAAPFKILVVAGEAAVNIIQQKTAVSPVVEVRDANGLPMSGVLVTFKVTGSHAAFGSNLQTVTLTTNAAGRAAAGAMTPLSPGVVEIQASASVQGQVATTVITQTNFATVAAATAAGATVAGASGAAAGAGAGAAAGGGLSAGTIALVGGAVAGGTFAATQLKENQPPAQTTFSGSYSVQRVETITTKATGATCTQTWQSDGTLKMTIEPPNGNSVSGSVDVVIVETVLSTTCAPGTVQPPGFVETGGGTLPVSGTKDAVQFNYLKNESGPSGSATSTFNFLGVLANGAITGTIMGTETSDSQRDSSTSSLSFPITLR